MVQALLAGMKTQTRRIVKPQPTMSMIPEPHFVWNPKKLNGHAFYFSGSRAGLVDVLTSQELEVCPYGQVGDILWVRETFVFRDKHGKNYFKADYPNYEPYAHNGWKPSIHMPKVASRIWLEITDIRVQRAQDISEEDAIAEGVGELISSLNADTGAKMYVNYEDLNDRQGYFSPQMSFITLWECINGHGTWKDNLWVWAVSFKVLSTTGRPDNK